MVGFLKIRLVSLPFELFASNLGFPGLPVRQMAYQIGATQC